LHEPSSLKAMKLIGPFKDPGNATVRTRNLGRSSIN